MDGDIWHAGDPILFGPFRLIAAERLLLNEEQPVVLGGRALDILIALTQRTGEVVSRQELIDLVWPGVTVEKANLRVHVANLRKALGDGRDGARYIANVPGRGYCFVAGIQRSAPPAAPSDASGSLKNIPKLPARLQRIVGRDEIVAALSTQLTSQRFLSIVGPGGIGKTTVAVAVAHALVDEFDGVIFFVDLSVISDAALIVTTVASALGCLVSGRDPLQGLLGSVADKKLLLVLDSCEHLIEAVAGLAERIFAEAPSVHLLTTTREALRVEGEEVHLLSPLHGPRDDIHLTASEALASPAVQLFMERALARGYQSMLSDADAPIVAKICERLDGLALAIELAASRVGTYGIRGIAELLEDRLTLLWQGRRNVVRHQTLQSTLDWSYDLLSEPEKRIFTRLSVFVGGFTLQAAQAVVDEPDREPLHVAKTIAGLVDKSLLSISANREQNLFRLMDTTRAYAAVKLQELGRARTCVPATLAESGEFKNVARRHADYYRNLFEDAETELDTLSGAAWLARYGHQIGQVRAALDWAFSPTGSAEIGTALTAAALPLWVNLSLTEECRGRVERALFGPAETRDTRRNMQLYSALGAALFLTKGSCPETAAAFASSFEIAESLDDTDYRLRALWGSFMEHVTRLRYRAALTVAERFLTCAEKSADPADKLIGDRLVGVALLALGDLEGARRHIELMLGRYVARTSHIIKYQFDQPLLAYSYRCRILWLQGFADQALASVESHLVSARASDHPYSMFSGLLQTACPVALLVGDLTLAERYVTMLMDLAARHAVELWALGGQCFKGVLLVESGNIGGGLELLRSALARIPQGAFTLFYTPILASIADALGRDGKAAEGLSIIDQALVQSDSNEERWCVAELLRIKGELKIRQGERQAAEAYFLDSLDWARRQGALSWELRTSTSLARLWRYQGRIDEARRLLKPVYDRLSEGFETADAKNARACLNSLH